MPLRVIDGIEELRSLVGEEVSQSEWFAVDQKLIDDFAAVSRDRQWIHTDPARAKTESPFGGAIAHGFLTLSLLSHLASQAVKVQGGFKMAINYGLNRVRFPAPVPAGSRIRARLRLQSLDELSGCIQLTWAATVEVEGASKPSLAAEWLVRYYQ
ncbi:MAG TPA: MaoC family dehydratase [Bryobacterales bacterium]|nr:MaoC family dehydratase [Bryobacterales bacterium]